MSSTEARLARGASFLPDGRRSTLVACIDEALLGRGGCNSVLSGSYVSTLPVSENQWYTLIYSRKHWQDNTLVNLANCWQITTKFFPSNLWNLQYPFVELTAIWYYRL